MRLRKNSSKKKAAASETRNASSAKTKDTMGALPSSCMEDLGDSLKAKAFEAIPSAPPDSPKGHRLSPLARLRKHHHRVSSASSTSSVTYRGSQKSVKESDNHNKNEEATAKSNRRSHNRRSNSSSKSMEHKHSLRRSMGNFFKGVEELFFPHSPLHAELAAASATGGSNKHLYGSGRTSVRGGVMLHGCHSVAEHYQKLQQVMDAMEPLHGSQGLAAAGLEFRHVLCAEHRPSPSQRVQSTGGLDMLVSKEEDEGDDTDKDLDSNAGGGMSPLSSQPGLAPTEVNTSLRSTESLWGDASIDSLFDNEHLMVPQPPPSSLLEGVDEESVPAEEVTPPHCHLCHRRLFHIETNTPITLENRKRFIADGDMYERIADLCQDYAHEVMCDEAELEWVMVEDDEQQEGETTTRSFRRRKGRSISALVNSNHPLIETLNHPEHEAGPDNPMAGRPTLLIATGRGKVRAGIFSRQHLICTSLESSTALPIVREARQRKMNVVIPDPNAKGERYGYETFRKTMTKLFSLWEEETTSETTTSSIQQDRDLYILSHSASGAQVARYLMDHSESYVPHIQAIAFTDSTHNIQWTKNDEELHNLLESPRCVYYRCSNEQRDSNWYRHVTGEEIKTDEFWRHRFGNIKTYWAGTNEHSLTNWYSHRHIWEHFDSHLSNRNANITMLSDYDDDDGEQPSSMLE